MPTLRVRTVVNMHSSTKETGGQPSASILKRLYPDVTTVKDVLLRLVRGTPLESQLQAVLIQPKDPASYKDGALLRCLCSVNATAPTLRSRFTLQQHSSQAEILNRAIKAILRSQHGQKNVLCHGFRKRVRMNTSAQGMLTDAANTTTAQLQGEAWQLLLSRVGDTLMLFLLMHTSLFLPLPHGCYLQASGTCIAQGSKGGLVPQIPPGTAAFPVAACAGLGVNPTQREAPGSPATQDISCASPGSPRAGVELSWPPQGRASKIAKHNEAQDVSEAAPSCAQPGPCAQRRTDHAGHVERSNGRKRAQRVDRPSSWQRRRAARLRQAAVMQQSGLVTNEGDSRAHAAASHSVRSTVPPGAATVSPQSAPQRTAPMANDGCKQQKAVTDTLRLTGSGHGEQQTAAPVAPDEAALTWHVAAAGAPCTQMLPETPIELWDFDSGPAALPALLCTQGAALAKDHQEAGERASAGEAAPAGGKAAGSAQQAAGQAQRPAQKPSDMLIPRTGLFYCATFPCKPGLPSTHILNALQGQNGAPRMLYAAIFLAQRCTAQQRQGWAQQRRQQQAPKPQLPKPPRRIPASLKPLLAALRCMLGRAPKCPYGILLDHHCPLPECLRRTQADVTSEAVVEAPRTPPRKKAEPADLDMSPDVEESACGPESANEDMLCDAASAGSPSQCPSQESPHLRLRLSLSPDRDHPPESSSQAIPAQDAAPKSRPALAQHAELLTQAPSRSEEQGHRATQRMAPAATAPRSWPAPPPEELIRELVPHCQVTAFVWSAVRHAVPMGLLGDAGSRRSLRRAVSQLVRLRRYEQMSVQQALHRLAPMPALRALSRCPGRGTPPSAHAAAQARLAAWVAWLLGGLVVPLLRACFYVTESEAYRQQVFYYRKPVWLQLQRAGLAAVRDGLFRPMAPAEARATLQGRQLGIAALRLLPKRTGMRPIVNLGRASHVSLPAAPAHAPAPLPAGAARRRRPKRLRLSFRPVNFHLQNLHKVLKYEADAQPGALGASVFGYNDAYAALQPLLRLRRAQLRRGNGGPPVYVVAADVSRAFDGVDIDRLLRIAEPLLRAPEYVLVKHVEVMPAVGGCVRTAQRCAALDAAAPWPGFPAHAARLAAASSQRVFSDKVVYGRVKRAALLQQLREHLRRNLVRFGKTWHCQTRGIPQGSSLSTLLCCIFLGALERQHLFPLIPPAGEPQQRGALVAATSGARQASGAPSCSSSGPRLTGLASAAGATPSTQQTCSQQRASQGVAGVRNADGEEAAPPGGARRGARRRERLPSALLRLVDDFLFVTPSRAAAEAVATRLLQGFPDYGVCVNPAKTSVSFAMAHPQQPGLLPRNTYEGAGGQQFVKWCGLLVNVHTLELQADYTRYAGASLAASLTIPRTKEPGRALTGKLCAHLRPKCHPLLFDTALNSPSTVRLNLYQLMLLAAMKLHCQVAETLPQRRRGSRRAGTPGRQGGDQQYVLAAIRCGIRYVACLVQRRAAAVQRRLGTISCRPAISTCHIRWLGLRAFQRALGRKQARYQGVLAAIAAELQEQGFRQLDGQLAAAVDPVNSAVFDQIIY